MAEYAGREAAFDASLGDTMGGWMLDVAKADLARQQGWLEAVQALATPDKNGNIPQITIASGITGPDGKPLAGADITFPVVLAMLGEQFAAETADLAMTMNVSASTLDETKGEQAGTAEGEGKFGIGALSVSVKVSASFSESEDHKRESDYRATTTASIHMARVSTPEPIQRLLEAFMKIVDVECAVATAIIQQNATAVAQDKGLLPAPDDTPAPGPDPDPAPDPGPDDS